MKKINQVKNLEDQEIIRVGFSSRTGRYFSPEVLKSIDKRIYEAPVPILMEFTKNVNRQLLEDTVGFVTNSRIEDGKLLVSGYLHEDRAIGLFNSGPDKIGLFPAGVGEVNPVNSEITSYDLIYITLDMKEGGNNEN